MIKNWYPVLVLWIVLLSFTSNFAQLSPIQQLDSNSVQISKEEFRFIVDSWVDLKLYKENSVLFEQQIKLLKLGIGNLTSTITVKNKSIEILQKEIDRLQPTWWDKWKFYIGTTIGFVITILLMR